MDWEAYLTAMHREEDALADADAASITAEEWAEMEAAAEWLDHMADRHD